MRVSTCDRWIECVSAMADAEEPELPAELVLAHVRECESCAAFARQLGVAAPSSDPDQLVEVVVSRNAAADRSPETLLVSALLAIAALAIIAYSIPPLLFGEDSGGSPHTARHLGAFEIAFAVALLVAAWRPARARSILPVALVLVLAIAITTVVDVIYGHVTMQAELLHLPELMALPLVWLLATPPEQWPGRRSRT